VPPLRYIIDARETIAASWSTPFTEPPVPHAELLTLAKLGETIKMPLEKIEAKLSHARIDAGAPEATLGEIAERHGLRPSELYAKIREGEGKAAIPIAEGGGYGQKTVRQVSDQLQIPVADVMENLRRQGIEAAADSNVKALATEHGKLPIEIVRMMQGPTES
jgi:hypothetical protein